MSGLPEEITYTKVPNFILDNLMAELRGGEFKVALAICRKTFGYHKKIDGIPISQIMELTGLVKNSVLGSISSLIKKKIIRKFDTTTPYRYSINVSNHIYTKPQKRKTTNNKPIGSNNAPKKVQKVNRFGVQKMNPQKKELKEKKKTTTSSRGLSQELLEVINCWNEVFPDTLDPSNTELTRHIEKSISQFSVKQINEAIFRRSNSNYYRNKKPQLIDKPNAFFPYPETIMNDLSRKTDSIFNYDEKNERIFNRQNKDEDFEIIWDMKDNQGRPLWKLKNA